MEKPYTAHARKRLMTFGDRAITKSAPAGVIDDTVAVQRGSRGSTTRPRHRRPVTAIIVVMATATAASERSIVGSRSATWCTMKPTWANSASAKDAVIVQNPKFPRSNHRDVLDGTTLLDRGGSSVRRSGAPLAAGR